VGILCLVTVCTVLIYWPRPFFDEALVLVSLPEKAHPDGRLSIDVVVTGRHSREPVEDASVTLRARAMPDGQPVTVTQSTPEHGLCSFRLPASRASAPKNVVYTVDVRSAAGTQRVHGHIPVGLDLPLRESPPGRPHSPGAACVLTDKPIYQPSQMIRYAAYVLNRRTLKPRPGIQTHVQLLDPRGNLVAQQTAAASPYGIARGEFPIAGDVLTGNYTLRVVSERLQSDKKILVRRYVRRRIEIVPTFEPPYLTGATGSHLSARLRYFSGDPVRRAQIALRIRHGDKRLIDELTATTDDQGQAQLELPALPKALDSGKEWTRLTVEIETDDGGTPEAWKGELPLFRRDRIVEILPEGGTILPGEQNRAFLVAYYPDGRPASGSYRLRVAGDTTTVTVDDGGLAEVGLDAPSTDLAAVVTWKDGTGRLAETQIIFPHVGSNQVRASLPFNLYTPGDALPVTISSRRDLTSQLGKVHVSLTDRGGAVAEVTEEWPKADSLPLAIQVPQHLDGPVRLRCVATTRDGFSYSTHMNISIARPKEPRITLACAKKVVLPGESNGLHLRLEDRAGEPLSGAATVAITDASILARAGAVSPEAEHAMWLAQLRGRPELPPPLLAAVSDGTGLPFLPARYHARPLRVYSNAESLERNDRKRYATWKDMLRALLLSLVGGAVIYVLGYGLVQYVKEVGAQIFDSCGCILLAFIISCLAGLLFPAIQTLRCKSGFPPLPRQPRRMDHRLPRRGQPEIPPLATAPRTYFPETLLFLPEVLFDPNGEARVPVKAADNITTWHASAVAVASSGGMGAAGTEFLATKPFFIEADLPVAFIQGDEPLLRLRAFNRGPKETVNVVLEEADFYSTEEHTKSVPVEEDSSAALSFPVRFSVVGEHRLNIRAECGEDVDIVSLPIEVTPNGREVTVVTSGRLPAGGATTLSAKLPRDSVLRTYQLRAYPSIVTDLGSGLEGMLRRPYGCFEQTTSVNYPNLMVLKYLEASGTLAPQVKRRALRLIRQGYQRLLRFEVRESGGFSLYGRRPARGWLSAYGLMQFHDMSEVIEVDPKVIERTWAYLSKNLESMSPAERAFVAWAGAKTGRDSEELKSLIPELQKQTGVDDPHLALLAAHACIQLSAVPDSLRERVSEIAQRLLEKPGAWSAALRTLSSARGKGALTEALSLACIAQLRLRGDPDLTERLLRHIVQLRGAGGAWPGTQATILALRAISELARPAKGQVTAHAGPLQLAQLTFEGNESTPPWVELPPPGDDHIEITFTGQGALNYAFIARGQLRWRAEEDDTARKGLNLRLELSKTDVSVGAEIPVTAVLQERGEGAANCMIEVGLAPGLSPNPSSLRPLLDSGKVRETETTDGRLILYLGDLQRGQSIKLDFTVVAALPGTFTMPPSRAYEYYRPENLSVIPGAKIHVRAK